MDERGDVNVVTAAGAPSRVSLGGFARLAGIGERRAFAAGSVLMRQGEESSCMFVILGGTVSVVREHPHISTPIALAHLGPGEIVGEMGLLDGDPRSATVTALEDTLAVEISGEVLQAIVAEHPDVYASLTRVLSKRLRTTNDLAAEAVGQGKRNR